MISYLFLFPLSCHALPFFVSYWSRGLSHPHQTFHPTLLPLYSPHIIVNFCYLHSTSSSIVIFLTLFHPHTLAPIHSSFLSPLSSFLFVHILNLLYIYTYVRTVRTYRGYAFVEFEKEEDMTSAYKNVSDQIDKSTVCRDCMSTTSIQLYLSSMIWMCSERISSCVYSPFYRPFPSSTSFHFPSLWFQSTSPQLCFTLTSYSYPIPSYPLSCLLPSIFHIPIFISSIKSCLSISSIPLLPHQYRRTVARWMVDASS